LFKPNITIAPKRGTGYPTTLHKMRSKYQCAYYLLKLTAVRKTLHNLSKPPNDA